MFEKGEVYDFNIDLCEVVSFLLVEEGIEKVLLGKKLLVN